MVPASQFYRVLLWYSTDRELENDNLYSIGQIHPTMVIQETEIARRVKVE